MTRKEFLERAAEQAFFSNVDIDKEGTLGRLRKMTCFNVEDGKIFSGGIEPVGITALEYIYAFGKDMPENVRWL